jgi:hypothetical protein
MKQSSCHSPEQELGRQAGATQWSRWSSLELLGVTQSASISLVIQQSARVYSMLKPRQFSDNSPEQELGRQAGVTQRSSMELLEVTPNASLSLVSQQSARDQLEPTSHITQNIKFRVCQALSSRQIGQYGRRP